jgi:hypothetical protein
MNEANEGAFQPGFLLDNRTGRFLKHELEHAPSTNFARRFSCVFLSASGKDAVRLNHHLSAAGIRAFHARDVRESEALLAITSARILLIDIDHTFELWQKILQRLEEAHPNVPKVVLTQRHENTWSLICSHLALDVISKTAHLGDLLEALECAHSVEREINDPQRGKERIRRVLAAIRSAPKPQTSQHLLPKTGRSVGYTPRCICCSIGAPLSAMMGIETYAWWKARCHRRRRQHSHA